MRHASRSVITSNAANVPAKSSFSAAVVSRKGHAGGGGGGMWWRVEVKKSLDRVCWAIIWEERGRWGLQRSREPVVCARGRTCILLCLLRDHVVMSTTSTPHHALLSVYIDVAKRTYRVTTK